MRCSTLIELLRYRASHQPEQIAYIFLTDGEVKSEHLTYQALDLQAQAIALILVPFSLKSKAKVKSHLP